MVAAVELYEPCPGYRSSQVATSFDAYGPIVATVKHQRWRADQWQLCPHIGIAQRLKHRLDCPRAGGGPQQPAPPTFCLPIADKAWGKSLNASRASPIFDELL